MESFWHADGGFIQCGYWQQLCGSWILACTCYGCDWPLDLLLAGQTMPGNITTPFLGGVPDKEALYNQ
jgi:hypothetical protein